MNSLSKLVQQAEAKSVDGFTFAIGALQMGARSKSGNYGFRVTCDNGTKVSFWASNMESVVEETTEGNFRVLPGVRMSQTPDADGYLGLIPEDAEQGGYWK
jgi:hypothetical protein